MANWDSYTQKSTPEDADTLMIKDTSGAANKRTPFSGVWNWIKSKIEAEDSGVWNWIKSKIEAEDSGVWNWIKSKIEAEDSGVWNWIKSKIEAEDLSPMLYDNSGAHNAIYRGKYLGSSVTQAQWNAISAGTFDDLYVGDYWTIGGVNWRIAAFDYYYNCGDTNFTKHHVVIVPDTALYTHVMNDTNITTGAYVGSKMYTEGLEQAKTTINNAFGSSHVLSHRIYLSNTTSNGCASAGAWADSTVDLMCEHMVYGSGIFSPVSDGSTVPNNYRVEKSQLPLFAHNPRMIAIRSAWWLRDVITSAYFALVNGHGLAYYDGASSAFGVRPAFCIGI